MAPQSNPDSLTDSGANTLLDTPSEDDLLALVPDMELLESSTIDALSAQSAAAAAAGSGRRRLIDAKADRRERGRHRAKRRRNDYDP